MLRLADTRHQYRLGAGGPDTEVGVDPDTPRRPNVSRVVIVALVAATAPPSNVRAAPRLPTPNQSEPPQPELIEMASKCGSITRAGCCYDNRVVWCERGRLVALDCHRRPVCGWRPSGIYDCGTAGRASSDAQGRRAGRPAPYRCNFGKGGAPPRLRQPRQCKTVSTVGCCVGSTLKFCDEGRLRAINCSGNLRCGWRGVGQLYNCGTEGKADPSGRHPKSCSAPRQSKSPTQ